jgi:hypothetical protein
MEDGSAAYSTPWASRLQQMRWAVPGHQHITCWANMIPPNWIEPFAVVTGLDENGGGLGDGFDAVFCSDPTEKESTPDIAKECDHHSGKQEDDLPLPGRSIKFAEKKGNHDRRLKGSDAAARFIDTQQSGFDLNHVSVLQRRNIREL